MTTYRMCPNALHFKEFYGGYHGTCGETALATALVCATPQMEVEQDAINLMLQMTKEMIGLGWADSSGATTMERLREETARRKFLYDNASYISFSQPLPSAALHALLLSTAGLKPILLEIATAGAGLPGDEAGVQYHFICIVGITDAGYVCNDGDNSAIESHLVTYSWSEIEAATPCAVMVVDLEEGAFPVGIPAGWTDDGTSLKNPANSFVVVHGFRDYIFSHYWDANNVPLEDEVAVTEVEESNTVHGAGHIQRFHFSQLSWQQSTNTVFLTYIGNEAKFLRDQSDKQAATIASLEAQIKLLQSQPVPAPVQTPVDPAIHNALSAALNILQPYDVVVTDLKTALSKLPQ